MSLISTELSVFGIPDSHSRDRPQIEECRIDSVCGQSQSDLECRHHGDRLFLAVSPSVLVPTEQNEHDIQQLSVESLFRAWLGPNPNLPCPRIPTAGTCRSEAQTISHRNVNSTGLSSPRSFLGFISVACLKLSLADRAPTGKPQVRPKNSYNWLFLWFGLDRFFTGFR